MHILTTTVSAKKGDKQTSRWLITQDRPSPYLEIKHGRAEWTNFKPGTALRANYRAYLLRSDIESIPQSWDRTYLAGYGYHNQGVNPGSLVYRGRSLGEMTCEICPHGFTWRVGYNASLSRTETDWLEEQLGPYFRDFILEHETALKKDAVAAIREQCEKQIADARAAISVAEAAVYKAIDIL